LNAGLGQIPHPDDATRQATAKTIGDPLAVRTVADATAGSYGAGLAPFFLGLATWIGAFVLFLLVRPLSTRALATGRSALRTALAGVGLDVLVLAAYLVGGLAVSTLAARRQRVWTPSRLAPELVL